eukprot:m.162689 g.162689  ORF g.162689 m.162689 type:complete len:191 (-) comp53063_c0_seq16:167-739(-)
MCLWSSSAKHFAPGTFKYEAGPYLVIVSLPLNFLCALIIWRYPKLEDDPASQRLLGEQRYLLPTYSAQVESANSSYARTQPVPTTAPSAPPAYAPVANTRALTDRRSWNLPEDPAAWSVAGVAIWLRTVVELPEPIVNAFVSNGVNGGCLQEAGEDASLDSLGITLPMQRTRIKRAVQALFSGSAASSAL